MHLYGRTTFKYLTNTHFTKVLLSVALFCAAALCVSAQAATVGSATGYVTATTIDGQVKRVAVGDKLVPGEVINTGNESEVTLTLANGEVITLGPLASYKITGADSGNGAAFGQRGLNSNSPVLSTATSAGGGIIDSTDTPTTPPTGGSPVN